MIARPSTIVPFLPIARKVVPSPTISTPTAKKDAMGSKNGTNIFTDPSPLELFKGTTIFHERPQKRSGAFT